MRRRAETCLLLTPTWALPAPRGLAGVLLGVMALQRLHCLGCHLGRGAHQSWARAESASSSGDEAPTVGLVLPDSGGRAAPGYTLFTKTRGTFLIDNDGRLVHEWKCDRSAFVAYLSPRGTLLRLSQPPRFNGEGQPRDEARWNKKWSEGGGSGYLQEWSWDGELLWEFAYTGFLHHSHHDVRPCPCPCPCWPCCCRPCPGPD